MRRILFDQGMPLTAAEILRAIDWDAVHVRELGMQQAADSEILEFAARESRVVVTLDRDFPQILALTSARGPSVVLVRQQRLRGAATAALIQSLWSEHAAALDQGCVLKVGPRGARVRLLPLR